MKLDLVAVFDRALGAYGRPAFVPTTGVAVRSFGDEVNRRAPDNQISVHPEDYELFHFGSFDDVAGDFELLTKPVLLVRAVDLVQGVQ